MTKDYYSMRVHSVPELSTDTNPDDVEDNSTKWLLLKTFLSTIHKTEESYRKYPNQVSIQNIDDVWAIIITFCDYLHQIVIEKCKQVLVLPNVNNVSSSSAKPATWDDIHFWLMCVSSELLSYIGVCRCPNTGLIGCITVSRQDEITFHVKLKLAINAFINSCRIVNLYETQHKMVFVLSLLPVIGNRYLDVLHAALSNFSENVAFNSLQGPEVKDYDHIISAVSASMYNVFTEIAK